MSPQFLEYTLDDGTTVLIQAPADMQPSGPVKSAGIAQQNIVQAERTFNEALESVRKQAKQLRQKLEDLRADEVEVTFSLTATGEVGNFAIGKVGIEANYEVTLKWKNTPEPAKKE
jgi:hypothetical protein